MAAYPVIADNIENVMFFDINVNDYSKPIQRGQAWNFVISICYDVGLRGNYGTRSLRITWGNHARMQGVDLVLIMHELNHESIAYTKRYLGISDDDLGAATKLPNL